MKIRLKLLFFVFALIFVIGCSKEEEKEDYSTVSNMIADRNKARLNQAAQKKASAKKTIEVEEKLSENISNSQTEKQKTPGITFEENVKIISESSGKTIATGIAYLDKSGKIINIRVKNR
ncbi:MAG: hypothetical protein HQK73_08780 [Desulfamplus sp.]|nr:hypothetical protein [Desulfamplus sp.]